MAFVIIRKLKLPIILDQKEVRKLLDQPSKTSLIGLRNRAILETMLYLGLRVSEITNLKPEDIDLAAGDLRVNQGKGGKDRDLSIPGPVIVRLTEWAHKRPSSPYFFPTLKGTKLLIRYLQEAIPRYAKKAGIKKRVYCHLLRHTYATFFYRQTKDIQTLRRILGHSSISTTEIYITLGNEEVKQSMKNFQSY